MNIGGLLYSSANRPEIDGLRALAVVAVIINHFDKSLLPGGFLGVDIFFVISGFVISASLAARPSNSWGDFFLGFYERRVKRLVPALVLCVVVTSMLICFFDPHPAVSIRTGLASLFGLSNLYLLHQSTDYFAPSAEANVFTQTWSLGVEEQFYIIFPLLVWLTGFGRLATGPRKLLWVVSGLSLSSLLGFIYLSDRNQSAAYFLMPTRLWELGAGCLLFLLLSGRGKFQEFISSKIPPLLLICAIAGVLFIPSQFLVQATLAAVLITMLLIASTRPQTKAYAFLTAPIIVYIGRISYSLYLWHWSVLSISRWTVGIHWWSAPFQIGAMLILAAASYRYIETPFRRAEWSPINWKTIGWGIAASVSSALIVSALLSKHELIFLDVANGIHESEAFLPLKDSALPYNPTCVVDGADRTLSAKTFDLCTVLPARKNGQMIWALGDSHAGHFQGLLYSIHDQTGLGVHLIETPGIPFPTVNAVKFEPRDIIFDEIKKRAHRGDILLLSRLFIDRQSEQAVRDLPGWSANVIRLAQSVESQGLNIVIVGPPPHFQFVDIQSCKFSLLGHSACDVDRASIATDIEAVYRSLENIAKQQHNVYIFDQFNIFCPKSSTQCSPIKNRAFLFRDKDHLNALGSASLTDPFMNFLDDNKLLNETLHSRNP